MKPFTVLTCAQRSPEWYAARCGVFTASRAYDAFRRTVKGDWRAERANYRTELVLEQVTGKPAPQGYQTRAMQNGIEREGRSLRVYENIHGVIVRTVGLVLDNHVPIGCSPDGVIGDFEGLVQAKCPQATTHLETIQRARSTDDVPSVVPPEYLQQIRHELYVTGASWCDYLSYHPDFPPTLQALTIRVTPVDVDLHAYANDVRLFLEEVDREREQIERWAAGTDDAAVRGSDPTSGVADASAGHPDHVGGASGG